MREKSQEQIQVPIILYHFQRLLKWYICVFAFCLQCQTICSFVVLTKNIIKFMFIKRIVNELIISYHSINIQRVTLLYYGMLFVNN